MAVIAALLGNASGEGFLVAPVGARTFPVPLSLQTDAGTADVTLRASPEAAGLVFSQMSCALTTVPTQMGVHATAKSLSRGAATQQRPSTNSPTHGAMLGVSGEPRRSVTSEVAEKADVNSTVVIVIRCPARG